MSGASPTAAEWHPDPTGRHQLRYWDGTAWTAWVADDGVQGEDPLAPETPGDREAVLAHTRLRFARVAGRPGTGWRAVHDDVGTEVARVWRDGPAARLCDREGAPVLTVTASGGGLSVVDTNGAVTAVSYTRARSVTLKCKTDGARVLTVQFRQSLRGDLRDGVLLDADKRRIGTIEQLDDPGAGSTAGSWLVVDRDPALTDPVRALAVASPLMIDCFVHAADRDADGPDLGMSFDD